MSDPFLFREGLTTSINQSLCNLAAMTTPTQKKKKANNSAPNKRLYLIRHGESMGQTAKRRGMNRKTDDRLRDAALTNQGIWQAQQLIDYPFDPPVELVVSSPLTRALHTAVLGFEEEYPILVHYGLCELGGSKIPENMPRLMKQVLADIDGSTATLDYTSLKPDKWPPTFDVMAKRCKSLAQAMQYLYDDRPEQSIAVVCHYNVIRQIVEDAGSLRPENANPIHCELQPTGQVVLLQEANC